MDQTPGREQRAVWAFWIACGLAAVAALAPLLLSGGSSRISGGLLPFALAAVGFALCAVLHHQGKPITTLLYFLASLGVVYGILSMLALPLRLAVLGTCPGPGPCPLGLERPMTTAEESALGFSIGMGIVAILTGFFGLRNLYHRLRMRKQADTPSTTPPTRRIPPVASRSETQATPPPTPTPAAKESEADVAGAEARAEPQPHAEPVAVAVAEPEPEPQAAEAEPEPQAELPAHEPDLELPAHVAERTPEASEAAPTPAPQRQPRRQRKPKAPPEPPASTSTE